MKKLTKNSPLVSVIMGSDSDWPIMKEACEVLEWFNVEYEAQMISAHRMPNEMMTFAKEAAARGVEVIIAGAGGSAHLPGMIASLTPLPVIGVPIASMNTSNASSLVGWDALLSIVQMPKGVPVATVAINGAKNAAYLATRILGVMDASIKQKNIDFLDKQNQDMKNKAKKFFKK